MSVIPTIKDVAREAGVSYATVSRALNNHPEVSEDTKKRVMKIALKMGYQPNAIAQGLVKKETKTVGLIIPDITNPFFPEVARGIEDAAVEAGYTIFLCNTNWNAEREERYLNVLMQKQVDGLIIGPSSEEISHLGRILDSGIKTVFISRAINHAKSTCIINFQSNGFLTEDMFPCGRSLLDNPCMCVCRGTDHYSVDIFPVEQFQVISFHNRDS